MGFRKIGDLPNIEKELKRFNNEIPKILANEAKNHYLLGFEKGGGQTDKSQGGWAKRKRERRKGPGKRAILVDTGQLRGDIDIRRTTFKEIVLGTLDTDYASYHNEGTEIHPQREFLGPSRKLDNKFRRIFNRELNKRLK